MKTITRQQQLEGITQGGLFHCTPVKNLQTILTAGAIRPNRGQFPVNHGLSRHSRCWKLGGIAVFDLTVAPRPHHFFQWLALSGLAIKLNRAKLARHLVKPCPRWQYHPEPQ